MMRIFAEEFHRLILECLSMNHIFEAFFWLIYLCFFFTFVFLSSIGLSSRIEFDERNGEAALGKVSGRERMGFRDNYSL